jgi:hypothetical protein
MSWYGNDVYSAPEKHGLELLGEVEWTEGSYEFDLTAVWKDKESGRLFWASDSGCSCPSPFEDFTSRDQLFTGTADELDDYLDSCMTEIGKAAAADLKLKVRS